ncbi:MAG: polysaccharide biosynthesis protein, partial [Cyclobacteriaceae bacterium]|nr:polysaccharide biosynthesis protein [Cyclobacteriaceae bacterium]
FAVVFMLFRSNIAAYFETNASDFLSYLTLTLWLTLILVITAVMESYSRALLKTVMPALLRDLVVRTLLGGFVLLYFMGYLTFDQFILSTLGAYLICLIVLLLYLGQAGDLRLTWQLPKLDPSLRKEMLRYSLFGFAGTAGMIIIGKIDSLMVAGMIGLSANAVYTTAFYMATVIEIPRRALSQVAMPLIARAFERNDMAEIGNLYQKTALNQFIIGLLLLLGVAANLNNLFALMPNGAIYAGGLVVVVVVGGGKLADMFFGPSSE